jgi:hypothetical protein
MAIYSHRILPTLSVAFALLFSSNGWAAEPSVDITRSRPFDNCRGWASIPIDYELGEVQSTLTREKKPFAFKVFARNASPYITMENGSSTVTFTFTREDQLHQVLVQSPVIQDEQDVLDSVGSAMERYGAPHEILEKDREEDAKAVTNYIWRNAQVELTVTVVHYKGKGYWLVWEDYIPARKRIETEERTTGVAVASSPSTL